MTLLLSLSISQSSRAAEVVPLNAGQAAPFTGYLFPPQNAVELAKRVEVCEQSRTADTAAAKATLELEQQACSSTKKVIVSAAEERDKLLQAALEFTQQERDAALIEAQRAWWESPPLLVGAGVVVGAGVTIGIVALLRP